MAENTPESNVLSAFLDYMDAQKLSEKTKFRYLEAIRKVMEYPDFDFTAEGIRSYLAWMSRENYKSNSWNFYYYVIKTVVTRVFGQEWPIAEGPQQVDEDDLIRPIFSLSGIKSMIEKVKSGGIEQGDLTRFAISTTFGIRRVEFTDQVPEDISKKNSTFRVHTAKHGDVRTHILPDEIKPYLYPDSLEPMQDWEVTESFKRIARLCGVPTNERYGWHSCRRRLVTYFDDMKMPEEEIYKFMRWKRRKTILHRYIVRSPQEADRRLADVDLSFFRVHPFLPVWAGRSAPWETVTPQSQEAPAFHPPSQSSP